MAYLPPLDQGVEITHTAYKMGHEAGVNAAAEEITRLQRKIEELALRVVAAETKIVDLQTDLRRLRALLSQAGR